MTEAVAIFRRALELEDRSDDWEPEGTRCSYLEACNALEVELDLRPWETSPLDADTDSPPEWMRTEEDRERWQRARKLHRELTNHARPSAR